MIYSFPRRILRGIATAFCCLVLTSCDVSTPTHTGDDSVFPSRNLKAVSYSELPDWNKDDVRYALQALRNSCKAKIQYTGRVIPDRALFEEKCNMLPSASADNSTIRAWFESHFQPYKIYNDNGGTKGTYTGYYSPVIPACRTKTAECNEPLMGIPTNGQNFKGVSKKKLLKTKLVASCIGQTLLMSKIYKSRAVAC